ncbi:ATP-binding protein [Sphingomonas sp. SAFR-052]|uniref:ATP-binding protein n=1 Tax=Sphingomonas sp. SAFR-052 TaxID=3436867 RepID=UPI003F7FF7D9
MRLRFPLFALSLVTAASAVPATGQATPLDVRFEAVRTLLLTDPQRVLRDGGALEDAAKRRDGDRSTLVAASKWLQAEAYVRLGDPKSAAAEVEQALALLHRLPGRYAIEGDVLRTRGDIAADADNVAGALADYQTAYRIYVTVDDRRGQAMALLSIGALYRQGADFEAALRYYGQAIEIYDDDPALSISLLNNRGNVLADMGRHRSALIDYSKALVKARQIGNRPFAAQILRNLARSQRAVGDFAAADRSIAEGLRTARAIQSRGVVDQLKALAGRLAADRGDLSDATRLVDEAFAGVDLTRTSLAMRDNHRNAYAVYLAVGDAAEALPHLAAIDRLNEQATQLTTSTKTALMSARFDFQNQELRIARLKQEELRRNIAFERASARFQRILFGSIAAAVAVLIALLSFGIVTLRRSRNAVRHANVELAATNVALEKALKAKGDFLATTSHEIRTPLNGILGMAQVMLRDTRLTPDLRDRLSIVHDAGVTMRALVDDILDVAKMQSGNLAVERIPTDLSATIEDLTRASRRQAEDRGLAFTLDIGDVPRWIEGDPVRLRQILFNLLSNALKFTEVGTIAVRAEGDAQRVRISVSDSGIGIAADRIDEVFESFQQADNSTTRRFGGTGLGLTICRNLARAMGGDIHVASVAGEGSTFTLDLPVTMAVPPASDSGEDAARNTLLILERNPIARGMMRTLFADHSASIAFVDDVAAVRARLQEGGVLALLMDMAALCATSDAPERDLAEIEAMLASAQLPAVLMLNREDYGVSIGYDAITLLNKPVSAKQLIDALFVVRDDRGAVPTALVSNAA